jgi:hypothetical protein
VRFFFGGSKTRARRKEGRKERRRKRTFFFLDETYLENSCAATFKSLFFSAKDKVLSWEWMSAILALEM